MNTLKVLLEDGLKERGKSVRAAAREIGVTHTTLMRVEEGGTVDLDTLIKICGWLGVQPASVLNAEGIGADTLAAQIAAVLETDPRLAKVFSEAMARILSGAMQPDTLRDLANYAAYRLGVTEVEVSTNGGRGTNKGQA